MFQTAIEPDHAAEQTIIDLMSAEPGAWWRATDLLRTSGGRLARGTIFVHLMRLEERGIVQSARVKDKTWGNGRHYKMVTV